MILNNLTSKPWAIDPRSFRAFRDTLAMVVDQEMFLNLSDLVNARPAAELDEDGTGHVWVQDTLGDKMPALWGMVGNTDYRQLREEVGTLASAGATNLVLHIDSPGGMVAGLEEAGAAIINAGLDTTAIVDGMACSAAYYLACCADRIIASPSSDVGNIGAVMAWEDDTAFWKSEGVEFNVLTNEGADLKGTFRESPMTSAQREFLQTELNRIGAEFRHHVDGNREVDPEVFRAGWYSGQRALDLGLIDTLTTS